MNVHKVGLFDGFCFEYVSASSPTTGKLLELFAPESISDGTSMCNLLVHLLWGFNGFWDASLLLCKYSFNTKKSTPQQSKKSPTGPFLNGPRKKPQHLIALISNLGVRWDSVPFNF